MNNLTYSLLPDLIEIQRSSFRWFLEEGLIEELNSFSPITDYTGKLELHFLGSDYKLKQPKYDVDEAKRRDSTYGVQMYVPTRLINKETGDIKEQEVFIGDLPLMTDRGTFIINGAERVIVNQIVRSPGVYYKSEIDKNGRRTYSASLIPNRGAWLKFETDKNSLVWVRIDKTRKLSAQVLLKAIGISDNEIMDALRHPDYYEKTLEKEGNPSEEDALLELYRKLRPGEPPTVSGGAALLESRFFDGKRYDLGRVGRYKLNKKLRLNVPDTMRVLTSTDILAAIDYLINLEFDLGATDDIDHLGNRRVRSVGELLQNQVRVGLNRLERIIRERMTVSEAENLTPASLVNPKPLVAAIKEFFGSSQLSQFMDQTNPLAELTHKRRLSALGPGGLTRERAGFAVRDIHPSHYGRICPVETPEGPNAGLIGSLATYARVNQYGFIETPYYPAQAGRVLRDDGPVFLTADEEDDLRVAPGDVATDEAGKIIGEEIPVRYRHEFSTTVPTQVDYVAVSPMQIVSVATSLIPFLEHDDANRALMGSNMQRQAVPLLRPERPLVGTGLEAQAARDSGMVVVSRHTGIVSFVDAERVVIQVQEPVIEPTGDKLLDDLVRFSGRRISKLIARTIVHELIARGGGVAGHTLINVVGRVLNATELDELVAESLKGAIPIPLPGNIQPGVDAGIELAASVIANQLSNMGLRTLIEKSLAMLPKGFSPLDLENALSIKLKPTVTQSLDFLAIGIKKSIPSGLLENFAKLGTKVKEAIETSNLAAIPEILLDAPKVIFGVFNSEIKVNLPKKPPVYTHEVEYELQKYQRSNQDTCLNQRPLVYQGEDVVPGQVLADGSATEGGELALGQNILVAYMPWEGYNYEDAILISERLVYDDVYTSIHVEKYEIEARQTKLGPEEITREIPNVGEDALRQLDERGIIRVGAWVEAGDILVGKVTPKGESDQPPEEKLLRAIFGEKARDVRDNSLRVPNGEKGRVVDVRVFTREQGDELPPGANMVVRVYVAQKRKIQVGDKMAGRHGNKGIISRILPIEDMPFLPDGTPMDIILNPLGVPSRMNVGQVFECLLGWAGENLGVRFKVTPFDEMYGSEASRNSVHSKLDEASQRPGRDWIFDAEQPGKITVYDGRTGEAFDRPVAVGKAYMLKLVHLVDDKIHARSTGPYSLVTQQPLGGKAQQGGQRFGEMEVWALEAYGAAYTLQELLTVKSDDMQGRNEALNAIVKGKPIPRPGTPESFKVLMRELQSLGLDIAVHKVETAEDGSSKDVEVDLMADVERRRTPSRPTYESLTAEDLQEEEEEV
ncbi:MAG: DNA-directed RNA polymerase subunit beta [Oscillatoria sp. PMC 1068.18]|nr:DNA-directed RNA polymerase subunit beta [Oscillatoria sp. PMC 1076.18]MEC4988507.1 DNA-directed RNA polymerase subunit beta [Oscillatoria sp. PMC 1068.18]